DGCAAGPRCVGAAGSTWGLRGRRCGCTRSTLAAWTAWTAPCSAPCAAASPEDRWGCPPWPSRWARRPRRWRPWSSPTWSGKDSSCAHREVGPLLPPPGPPGADAARGSGRHRPDAGQVLTHFLSDAACCDGYSGPVSRTRQARPRGSAGADVRAERNFVESLLPLLLIFAVMMLPLM